MSPSERFNRTEAAVYLKVSPRTLDRLNLPCIKLTRFPQFLKSDLDAFILSRREIRASVRMAATSSKARMVTRARHNDGWLRDRLASIQ